MPDRNPTGSLLLKNYPCEKRHTVPITEIIWALEIYYNIEFAELKSFGRVWNVLTFLFYVCIRKVRFQGCSSEFPDKS